MLYVAMVAVFVTTAISFAWDVVYGREKAANQQAVDQSARSAMYRIAYEIRRAKSVQSLSDYELILDNDGSTTTISLVGNTLQITTVGAGPFALTSNQVVVDSSNPIFTNQTTTDTNSANVGVNLTINSAYGNTTQGSSTTLFVSAELNSQFNQARSVLIDTSAIQLVSSTSVQGFTLENTGTNDITIDKLIASWTGTTGSENITDVQIGGGTVEWTGSQPTGSELDLTNYILTSGFGPVDVDYIDFDASVAGGLLELKFVFSDGSTNVSLLTLAASASTPTPTPTPGGSSPTPTPTPTTAASPTPTVTVATCGQYCAANGYATGFCDKNAGACSNAGAVNLSGGNQYCTGGPQADTCCCQ